MFIALSIVLAVAVIIFLSIYATFLITFKPMRSEVDEYRRIPDGPQYHEYRKETWALSEEFAALPYETVTMISFDGFKLYGRYYEVRKGAPIEIECHGYHGSPIRDFCGGNKIAREAGINTLVIEERAMHRSEGRAITFGINERFDVQSWAEYCYDRFGKDTPIILTGVSMGASTVLMASELALPPSVVGVVADCPYSSAMDIIVKVGKERKMPGFLIRPLVRLASSMFGHFDIEAATPLEAVKNTELPILLIHGDDDRFVPHEMSEELKKANPAIRFESFPGAGHGLSYMVDTERYVRIATGFIDEVLKDGTLS